MISVIKNIRMFVVHSILRGGKARQISAGIFYALADHIYVYGFVPPCRVLMDLLPLRWNATGKAEPFFYGSREKLGGSELNVLSSRV